MGEGSRSGDERATDRRRNAEKKTPCGTGKWRGSVLVRRVRGGRLESAETQDRRSGRDGYSYVWVGRGWR